MDSPRGGTYTKRDFTQNKYTPHYLLRIHYPPEEKPQSGFYQGPGRGSKPKLCPRDTRMTLKALSTPSKSGKRIHFHTVSRYLKRNGKNKRRPRKKPFLNLIHKKKRRAHCRAEKAMKRNNWKVCWSDEVTFEIGDDLTTFWVTRGVGREEEYAEKNLRPSFQSGRTCVVVYTFLSKNEKEIRQ